MNWLASIKQKLINLLCKKENDMALVTQEDGSVIESETGLVVVPAPTSPGAAGVGSAVSSITVASSTLSTSASVGAPEPDVIAKLETILSALGHKLPVFWSEAVALAKKAI